MKGKEARRQHSIFFGLSVVFWFLSFWKRLYQWIKIGYFNNLKNRVFNPIKQSISSHSSTVVRFPSFLREGLGIGSIGISLIILTFTSCQNDQSQNFILEKPVHFPAIQSPTDNELTAERVALGKKLFYEKALSIDSSISCESCHFQHLGFTDGKPKSIGVENRVGVRNAPALINLAYDQFFFRDGGVSSLETQAMSPINNEAEMAHGIHEAASRLAQDDSYQQLAKAAYDREMSAYVVVRALSAFQRTLISGNSKFDTYFYEQNESIFSESEKKGKAIFFGKGNCTNCHNGFNLTNFGFENNGLYENYTDKGRSRITLLAEDEGKFKVPTLRNVEKTAPYMHDGSLATLEEVVEHYNNGGQNHFNQSEFVKSLGLTEQEKVDLVSFLYTLTDETFLNNPKFR
ncbi:MAG: cytochrome-c peroxidase [Saprospiraceae bacterium]